MSATAAACNDFTDGLVAAMPRLRAFAYRLSTDRQLADDLVQDTLLQALASQHTFSPGTSQSAWLSTILRNRYFGILRRRRIATFVADDRLSDLVAVLPQQEDKLVLDDLLKAMGRLPAEQRELLISFTFGDLSYKDAAHQYGCSIGTIKSRISRARATLRETTLATAD